MNFRILSLGQLGVSLFFVLSGFLITYLLLAEQDIYGSISVKKFYSRRILRIWPLYYLIVTLGLFVLPSLRKLSGFVDPNLPIIKARLGFDVRDYCAVALIILN